MNPPLCRKKAGNGQRKNIPCPFGIEKSQRKLWKITAAVSAGILVILAAVLLIRKYMPTGQKMSGYDYFKTDSAAENDSTLVILDNEILYDKGRYIDGRLYLQQSFVQDNVNMRFYYDKESNAVLYSDWSAV